MYRMTDVGDMVSGDSDVNGNVERRLKTKDLERAAQKSLNPTIYASLSCRKLTGREEKAILMGRLGP